MNKIEISIEEAIMLESFKTIRKVHNAKNITREEKSELLVKLVCNTNRALDILGVK